MTVEGFRAFFPAFKNVDKDVIQAQLTLALNHLDETAWGIYYDEGTACWVAHSLVVNRADGAPGGAPAGADGPPLDGNDVTVRNRETIDISRDAGLLAKQQRDPYLRSTWGQRYRYLANIVGVGALAVGGC